MRWFRTAVLAMALIALVFVVIACNGQDPAVQPPDDIFQTPTPGPPVSGTVEAADQTSDGTTITITSVHIVGSPGFVVVHADEEDAPGPVLGYERVDPGTTTGVEVALDDPIASGTYWVMLHVDANATGFLDFPGPDEPVLADDGRPVMMSIEVTVA